MAAICRRAAAGAVGATAFISFSNSAFVICVLQFPPGSPGPDFAAADVPDFEAAAAFAAPVGTSQTPSIVITGAVSGTLDSAGAFGAEGLAAAGAVGVDWLPALAAGAPDCAKQKHAAVSRASVRTLDFMKFKMPPMISRGRTENASTAGGATWLGRRTHPV